MKTSKFVWATFVGMMLLVSSVFAKEKIKPGVDSYASENLRSQLINALSDVPAVNQEVTIHFSISDKKGFALLKVDGADVKTIDAVTRELANEKFSVPSEMKGTYSLKVRFSENEIAKPSDPSEVLRNQIAAALTNVNAVEPTSVKLAFSVTNNQLTLKNVEGTDKALVLDVKNALANTSIVPPADLSGNFQLMVKF